MSVRRADTTASLGSSLCSSLTETSFIDSPFQKMLSRQAFPSTKQLPRPGAGGSPCSDDSSELRVENLGSRARLVLWWRL